MVSDKLEEQLEQVAEDAEQIGFMLSDTGREQSGGVRLFDGYADALLDEGYDPADVVSQCAQRIWEDYENGVPVDQLRREQQLVADSVTLRHPDLVEAAYDQALDQYDN